MDQFNIDFASHWDELVDWEKRSAADTFFLLNLIQKFDCRSVLDVALGTGFHSIKLLDSGLKVKSVDISIAMIEVAKKNAAQRYVELDVIAADWVDLDKHISEKFDCIICLGNSLACEMDAEKRQQAVRIWSELLNEGGIVIVDRRNYEAVLSGEYNISSKGQYFGENVKITPKKVAANETLFSYTFSDGRTFDLKMFPILGHELNSIFMNAGLEAVETFGDRVLSYTGKDVGFYYHVFRKRESND